MPHPRIRKSFLLFVSRIDMGRADSIYHHHLVSRQVDAYRLGGEIEV